MMHMHATSHTPRELEHLAQAQEELARGFRVLSGLGPAVAMIGSARTPSSDAEHERAYRTAYLLGQAGYAVITGGPRASWRPPTEWPGMWGRSRSDCALIFHASSQTGSSPGAWTSITSTHAR